MGRFRRVGRRLAFAVLAGALFATLSASVASSAGPDPLRKIKHIVVIYEENHSFDNLYGGWEGVNGLRATPTPRTRRRSTRTAPPFACLQQNDVNLTSPPLPHLHRRRARRSRAHFTQPAVHDRRVHPAERHHVPAARRLRQPNGVPKGTGLPGGCTRDLVHRFYQEQYQLNGGAAEPLRDRQRRGRADDGRTTTRKHCRSTSTCIGAGHPHYAIEDDFFQARVRRLVPQPPVADRGCRRR